MSGGASPTSVASVNVHLPDVLEKTKLSAASEPSSPHSPRSKRFLDSNYLSLPRKLWPLRVPALDDDRGSVQPVQPVKKAPPPPQPATPSLDSVSHGCGLFACFRFRRPRPEQPLQRSSVRSSVGESLSELAVPAAPAAALADVGVDAGANREVWSTRAARPSVEVQIDPPRNVLPPSSSKLEHGASPPLRGLARSPFVDGLRSATRDAPGRLVRAVTGNSAPAKGGAIAFSVHA